MNKSYVEYDSAGRIICSMSITDEVYSANKEAKPNLVEGVGLSTLHYVKDGQIVDRPTQATSLDGQVLINLPIPCTIQINDDVYDCDDDHAELELDFPITYRITVRAWPYLDMEFTYENQP